MPRLALSVGFGPVNSPPRLTRTLQLSMTTSQAAAAASGPERTMRTSVACEVEVEVGAAGLRAPFRETSAGRVAPHTRFPGGPQFPPLHPFTQKEPQRFDHRLGEAARTTLIAAWPFNPVDHTGHKAACRWSHRPLLCQSHGKAGCFRDYQQPP